MNFIGEDFKGKLPTDPGVLLLFGGVGCEREISKSSAERFFGILTRLGISPIACEIFPSGDWYIHRSTNASGIFGAEDTDGDLIAAFPIRSGGQQGLYTEYGIIPIAVVLPVLHGEWGEDGKIQGLLDSAGIPYIGAGATAGAVCHDKVYSKLLADSLGVPTLPHVLYIANDDNDGDDEPPRDNYDSELTATRANGTMPFSTVFSKRDFISQAEEQLGYPIFIKPADRGSSYGAGRADNRSEFYSAISRAKKSGSRRIMAEPCLTDKRELECAVLENPAPTVYGPYEVLISGFYGFFEKYKSRLSYTSSPSGLTDEFLQLIRSYSLKLFSAAEMRHLGRVDFFLADDKIYFNEINSFPGFTKDSLYSVMLRDGGIDEAEFISILLGAVDI